tara:strand:+ start:595 stop:1755 length:1161 start_codon:yes stop_codon:yes gene_type:complete
MNVTQMHLAIKQGVDKINSLQADLLLSEELDIELNKSMSRFINSKYGINNTYNKGFEESQKRVDDLRTLVVEYSNTVIYKEQYDTKIFVDTFQLPVDYLYLVNQRSEVLIDNCDPINFGLQAVSGDFTYFKIPYNNLNDGVSTYVRGMSMVADTTNLLLGDVPMINFDPSSTYAYPADDVALQTALLDPLNWGVGFQWYLDSYAHLNFPGHYIVIVDTDMYPWVNHDASVTNTLSGSNAITQAIGIHPTGDDSLNTFADLLYDDLNAIEARTLIDGDREYSLNKFVQHDDISKLLEDPFNTTKHTAPLTTIRGNNIDLYTSDIFIIDRVKITYIRKPQKISLSLGIDCELPEHCHQEIVDMTVSSILEGISDPRYKSASAEANKNE